MMSGSVEAFGVFLEIACHFSFWNITFKCQQEDHLGLITCFILNVKFGAIRVTAQKSGYRKENFNFVYFIFNN